MYSYLIMVEGLTERYMNVKAKSKAEAKELAKKEFCSLVGSQPESITQCKDLTHFTFNK